MIPPSLAATIDMAIPVALSILKDDD